MYTCFSSEDTFLGSNLIFLFFLYIDLVSFIRLLFLKAFIANDPSRSLWDTLYTQSLDYRVLSTLNSTAIRSSLLIAASKDITVSFGLIRVLDNFAALESDRAAE